MNRGIAYIFLMLTFLSSYSFGGDRWNIRGLGMARTNVATSRGIDAIGINPANLAVYHDGSFQLNLFSAGIRASSDLISFETYNNYFTGVDNGSETRVAKYLSESDKNKILEIFPGGVATTRMDMDLMLFGLMIRPSENASFGFTISDHVGGKIVFPRDLAKMFLFGLDSTGSTYSFDNTNVSAWWWREYNLSYSRIIPSFLKPFGEIAVGAGFKLLRGYGLVETIHNRASLRNERIGTNQYQAIISADYHIRKSGINLFSEDDKDGFTLFPDPAGSGVGFDFGIATSISNIRLHLSVTNIGSISWDTNIIETTGKSEIKIEDPFSEEISDSLESSFKGKNVKGRDFSSSLPTTLRIGAAVLSSEVGFLSSIPGHLTASFQYSQGLNESMGNITAPRFSTGIEYKPIKFLPIRTGLSISSEEGIRWGFGFGIDLHYWQINISSENFSAIFSPSNLDVVSIAIGSRLRF